jgi:hypothetical protein
VHMFLLHQVKIDQVSDDHQLHHLFVFDHHLFHQLEHLNLFPTKLQTWPQLRIPTPLRNPLIKHLSNQTKTNLIHIKPIHLQNHPHQHSMISYSLQQKNIEIE